jgi:hypothetical protein
MLISSFPNSLELPSSQVTAVLNSSLDHFVSLYGSRRLPNGIVSLETISAGVIVAISSIISFLPIGVSRGGGVDINDKSPESQKVPIRRVVSANGLCHH